MPFCVRCGREVPVGGAFCPSCGSPVPPSAGSPPHPAGAPGPAAAVAAPAAEEWRPFLGPSADYYLARFPAFTAGKVDTFSVTWNWPVFFCSFWWFLYRKLYLHALVVFFLTMVPYVNLAAWIACPMAANYFYFLDGRKRILALRAANGGTAPPEALAAVGGVNRWVWGVAIVVTGLGLAAVLSGLLVIGTLLRCGGTSI